MFIRVFAALLFASLPVVAPAQTLLLMAEEEGCYWCEKWNEEIGPIYPKTVEGRTAPLERYDIYADTPPATLSDRVVYTPTFILVEDGVELGRIEGYPGEDFFWGLLNVIFSRANIPLDQSG